ncbi:hypothetical protein HY633_02110 [Candidatus Uhrbacteria bacterium]|nr:hypothetical protein [Candidatus Uhrbacteria bacterium]
MATSSETTCRIGLISRIDFGSDGFRQALLERAAEDFKRENVNYVILAGGLISARAIKDTERHLNRQLRDLKKQIRLAEKKAGNGKLAEERKGLAHRLEKIENELKKLAPEKIAEKLAECLPKFQNAKGESAPLYIVTSPHFDNSIGDEVKHLLAAKRRDDIRAYQAGGDLVEVKQANKQIVVLTPTKKVWLGGGTKSGHPEGLLRDNLNHSAKSTPDLYVIGGFGVTITKPKGEFPRYVTVPALHKLTEARTAEDQVGVRTVTMYRDRDDPDFRTYSYKDATQKERSFIGAPRDLAPSRLKIIEVLKTEGKQPTGIIAGKTGLSRETVEREAKAMIRDNGKSLKTWPGLVYDKDSNRWDFNQRWIKENLRYPPTPVETDVVRMVGFCCFHAGSVHTDYKFFLGMAKVILERGATILVNCGDSTQGLKHDLALQREVIAGTNVTDHEELAGDCIAAVNIEVFKARVEKPLQQLLSKYKDAKPHPDELGKVIADALLMNVMIYGNHDEWSLPHGHTPLKVMIMLIKQRLRRAVEETLFKKGLCHPDLDAIVAAKVVMEPKKHHFVLSSGLMQGMKHPYMARAATSTRPQQVLKMMRGCQVTLSGNFHTGVHLEVYEGELGQRVNLQLGTLMHSTKFEDTKLKIVDQGYAFLGVESVDKRVVATEVTFYGNDSENADEIDPHTSLHEVRATHGLPKV